LKSREKTFAFWGWTDSGKGMIQGGFPGKEDRGEPIALRALGPQKVLARYGCLYAAHRGNGHEG
jgi:hypothetical protein